MFSHLLMNLYYIYYFDNNQSNKNTQLSQAPYGKHCFTCAIFHYIDYLSICHQRMGQVHTASRWQSQDLNPVFGSQTWKLASRHHSHSRSSSCYCLLHLASRPAPPCTGNGLQMEFVSSVPGLLVCEHSLAVHCVAAAEPRAWHRFSPQQQRAEAGEFSE